MLSILTVDDEVMICDMIAEVLKNKGHAVRISQSGEDALRSIEEDKPDIVLLDLNMPGMGGEATLREIKRRYHNLPVIIVTVNTSLNKALELLREGASDYITKPIDFNYLEKNFSTWETIRSDDLQ